MNSNVNVIDRKKQTVDQSDLLHFDVCGFVVDPPRSSNSASSETELGNRTRSELISSLLNGNSALTE